MISKDFFVVVEYYSEYYSISYYHLLLTHDCIHSKHKKI